VSALSRAWRTISIRTMAISTFRSVSSVSVSHHAPMRSQLAEPGREWL
jgi:hypothetical protein